MKHEVQLYIEGQRIDLFEDESLQITSKIQDVRDISKIFSDFSASFSVKATRNNNLIFKHYHDFDIDNGYDARYKSNATIEVNYQHFRNGKIRLDGVQMKNGKAYAYKLTFIGETVNLKDILGEDLISDLDFSDYDELYTYSQVKTRLGTGKTVNGIANALICPLISAEQRLYYDSSENVAGTGNLWSSGTLQRGVYWQNLKYAIRVYSIIKAIEEKYTTSNGYINNIEFSTDFFNTSNANFYDLYMWLHREKGQVSVTGDNGTSERLTNLATDSLGGMSMYGHGFSIYDVGGGGAYYYDTTLNLDVSSSSATFDVILYKNGTVFQTFTDKTGSSSYIIDFGNLTNGVYEIYIEFDTSFTINSTSDISMTRHAISGNTSDVFGFVANQVLASTFIFRVKDQMPKMKVIDFLTGLFKMFNLTAYVDFDKKIIVKTLDSFYSGGTSYDITQYVDMENSEVNTPVLFNKIEFKYKGLKSYLTQNHLESFNKEWGSEDHNIEDRFEGSSYTVEAPFEHMKFERMRDVVSGSNVNVQWGWAVDKQNEDGTGQAYIGEPLLFYAPKATGTSIRTYYNGGYGTVSTFFVPSNSISLSDSQNINFKAERNEWTNQVMTTTLFDTYYSDYIGDVFNIKNRLIKVQAVLPLKILTKYTLADKFIIGDKEYKINSITSNLLNNKSNIELIPNL